VFSHGACLPPGKSPTTITPIEDIQASISELTRLKKTFIDVLPDQSEKLCEIDSKQAIITVMALISIHCQCNPILPSNSVLRQRLFDVFSLRRFCPRTSAMAAATAKQTWIVVIVYEQKWLLILV
jgi:hypothetical protein